MKGEDGPADKAWFVEEEVHEGRVMFVLPLQAGSRQRVSPNLFVSHRTGLLTDYQGGNARPLLLI